MWDDMYSDIDLDTERPSVTKTIGQSLRTIMVALALGAGVVSLFLIHYVATEIGYLIWMAVTMGPAFAAAYFLSKEMVGYHVWARLTVGLITFFSVAIVIAASLEAHHF